MSCHCCLKLVQRLFAENDIAVEEINLGEVWVSYDSQKINLEMIASLLEEEDFELLIDKDRQLVEQIKSAIINLVHYCSRGCGDSNIHHDGTSLSGKKSSQVPWISSRESVLAATPPSWHH